MIGERRNGSYSYDMSPKPTIADRFLAHLGLTREAPSLDYLHRIAQKLDGAHADAVVRTISPTRFAETILAEAKQRRVNLIAMATHGRGGLRRALLGSVADKILRGSTLPLLLVRPRRGARRQWESTAGVGERQVEVGIT